MNSSVLKRALEHLKHYGLHDFVYKTLETIHDKKNNNYSWEEYAPSQSELARQKLYKFDYEPKISILVPAYETKPAFLIPMLDSVVNQSYCNWELCLADASATDSVEKIVNRYKRTVNTESADRIKYLRLEDNCGIAQNTNRAYEMSSGDYITLLDHDDLLAKNALYEMAKAINDLKPEDRQGVLLYSDEDKIDECGMHHFYPHIKLDFNLEYLRTNNYICHLLVVSSELAKMAGGWRKEFDGAQDYDFILRCSEKAGTIVHVPKILYHWRVSRTSTAGDKYTKLYAYEAGRKAIEEHLKRCNESGTVSILKELGTYKVNYDMVSVNNELIPYQEIISDIDRYVSFDTIDSIRDICLARDVRTPFVMFVDKHVVDDSVKKMAEELVRYMGRETVAAVAPKVVSKRRVVQNGLCTGDDGDVIKLFNGLNRNYKGYFKRASLPLDAEGVMFVCTLARVDVINNVIHDDINNEMELSCAIRESGYELIQASDIVMGD